jgi:REP element-mobilizing transposase RayT
MKFNPQKHHRRSIRLKGYDYSQSGAYFITIVTYQRDFLFGKIVNKEMQLSDYGRIADECWRAIPDHFPKVELGAHVVVGARHVSPLPPHGVKPKSIGAIVGSFKSAVTRRIGREHNTTGIWQRNYYEHVIRDNKDWDRIHRYIESNPSMWAEDQENPASHA